MASAKTLPSGRVWRRVEVEHAAMAAARGVSTDACNGKHTSFTNLCSPSNHLDTTRGLESLESSVWAEVRVDKRFTAQSMSALAQCLPAIHTTAYEWSRHQSNMP